MHRSGGLIPKEKLRERFGKKEETSTAGRGLGEARAEMMVALGARALEGDEVAPGTRDTLQNLKDETKRPPLPRDPLPPETLNCSPR